jgi:DNA polymerase sigma
MLRYNSRLILAYCEISPHVLRPLIHCLKLWSKANHVNDPSGKDGMPTMSSYCLTLMAIGYLQHRGILPNLQEDVEVRVPDYPETEGKDVIWAAWGKPSGLKINVGFSDKAPADWEPSTKLTVSEAVRGFFSHFARTGSGRAFQYNTQVVSILNGGIINRAKPQGQETQEAQQRKAAGIPAPTKEEMIARETYMGKGDQGIQPRNWSERRLVVQDPFIWQKVS